MRGVLRDHRVDRDASRRQARARAHLDRMRQRRGAQPGGRGGPWLPRRAWVGGLAAACGLLFGESALVALAGDVSLNLETIAVHGADRLSPEEVATATGILAGTPVDQIDPASVRAALEGHDWIAEAASLRLPGGALLVSIVERKPVATLAQGKQLYAVDERGAPFAPVDAADPELVRLVAATEATPGEPSPALAEAVRLANRLPELGMALPTEVGVAGEGDPEGYTLRLQAMSARIVLGRSELDARLDDLARLMATRPDAVAASTDIDLRFANQVVLRSAPIPEGSTSTATGRGNAPPHNRAPTG